MEMKICSQKVENEEDRGGEGIEGQEIERKEKKEGREDEGSYVGKERERGKKLG